MAIDLKTLPKLPQRQDATDDQLRDLRDVANRLGMYDAADVIRNLLEAPIRLRASLVTVQTVGSTKPVIERVLEDIKARANDATGGDFAVVEYDLIPGCEKRLGLNAHQYGGFLTQLQRDGKIFVDKTTVNGNEKITQVTFPK